MSTRNETVLIVAMIVVAATAAFITVVSRRNLAVPVDGGIVPIPGQERDAGSADAPDVLVPAAADQPFPAGTVGPDMDRPPSFTAPLPIVPPLPEPASRMTKKGFGLYVSPQDSPVSPERFRGYHAGVDLEAFGEEQELDMEVAAICDGPLLVKRTASGYGGVAVQSCRIGDREATVVYGHLKLASIDREAGEHLAAGDRLGLLGRGFTPETDGERKHLHLSVHLGPDVDIRGYVQDPGALGQWLDPAEVGGWR